MATIDAYDTKDGRRWRVIYRKPDGTQTSRRGFQRKRDAQEWLAEHVTVAKASGTYIDPQAGRRKVGGLWPAWIAKKRVSSKASYVESLERAWRVHVEPQWGARTLESLTRAEIQEWVSGQAESKSATVVLRNLGILRGICADAVSDRLIPSNPCDGIETPRKKRKEHTYLTIEQLFRLADESGDRRTMVLVLGLCGLRWGEMAGLHVEDVDFARHRLSVRRSATTVSHEVVVDLPKSGRPRQVVFPSTLDAPLRDRCAGREGREPLFPAQDGGYLARTAPPNDPTKWFWRAKRRPSRTHLPRPAPHRGEPHGQLRSERQGHPEPARPRERGDDPGCVRRPVRRRSGRGRSGDGFVAASGKCCQNVAKNDCERGVIKAGVGLSGLM